MTSSIRPVSSFGAGLTPSMSAGSARGPTRRAVALVQQEDAEVEHDEQRDRDDRDPPGVLEQPPARRCHRGGNGGGGVGHDSEARSAVTRCATIATAVVGAANRTGAAGTVTRWRSPASPTSPAVCSPVATACSHRSVQARAVASTWPTTSASSAGSAVKVLHLALAEDAGFLRRFRAEAQVAASLNHPNVMAVYDWGEDDVPFMVLELLAGGSLRGMLDAGGRLVRRRPRTSAGRSPRALEYAHARGVVHRDIKPANLLFDEHGIVRVADFGLARALAEASWTEPAGTVVGTARYAAPEQATGAPLDGRADLYSLAVVLVEAVTGTVPAVADTAIGTLAARTHTPLVAPLALGRLGPVVERAGRPEPSERYPDAATMRAALADAARALPPPQPLPLAGLGGEIDGGPPTQIGRSSQPVRPGRARRTAGRRRRADPAGQDPPPARAGRGPLGQLRGDRRPSCWRSSAAGSRSPPCPRTAARSRCRPWSGSRRRRRPTRSPATGLDAPDRHPQRRRSRRHGDRPGSRAGRVRRRRRFDRARRLPRSAARRHHSRAGSIAGRRAGGPRGAGLRGERQASVRRDGAGRRRHRHRSRGRHKLRARLHHRAARERRPRPVPVPDVTGKTFDEASQHAHRRRLHGDAAPTTSATPCPRTR